MDLPERELTDVAADLEEILAAEAEGLFDLSPTTERWLLAVLDELGAAKLPIHVGA